MTKWGGLGLGGTRFFFIYLLKDRSMNTGTLIAEISKKESRNFRLFDFEFTDTAKKKLRSVELSLGKDLKNNDYVIYNR